MKISWWATKTS